MINVITCPVCQYQNPGDATKCINCGMTFIGDKASETLRVSDLTASVKQPGGVTTADLFPDTLALYIMGQKQPILIKTQGQEEIILGRSVFGEPAPTIDLTNYHGRLLGVSRHHAAIHVTADGYSLEDLNSSNGTWVNDNHLPAHQLTALHNGDLIRLGQLVLFVYFRELAEILNSTAVSDKNALEQHPKRENQIRNVSITVIGYLTKAEIRGDTVILSMLHVPSGYPAEVPALFHNPTPYIIYIPSQQWKKVELSAAGRSELFIIKGICSYDEEAKAIVILAESITNQRLRIQQVRHKTKNHRRAAVLRRKPAL